MRELSDAGNQVRRSADFPTPRMPRNGRMTQRWNYYLAERPFSRCLGQPLPNAAHVSLCSPCQTCELRSPGRLITGCGHGAINEKVLTEPDSRGLEGFGCGLGRAPPDASPRYRRSAHWRGRKGFAPCSDAHAVIGSTVCGCGGYFVASRRSGRRTPAYYGDVLRSGGINGYCRWAGW
jgi:hypothetical protein